MYLRIVAISLLALINSLLLMNKVLAQDNTVTGNQTKIEKIEIKGNTVFSDLELKKLIDSAIGKDIAVDRLFNIKTDISQFYLSQGYITSGVFFPPQEIQNGKIIIVIVEGSLAGIEIEGLNSLNEKYIESRLPDLNKPLNINDLTQDLNFLEEDLLIKEIEAELKPIAVGKSLLSLKIVENKPFQLKLNLSNSFSPTIGSFGRQAAIKHQNFLGFGDRLSLSYTNTQGLDRYEVDYSIPFNSKGGIINVNYLNSNSKLVEEAISAFDIQANFETYKVFIALPIIKSQMDELIFDIGIEKLESETFVAKNISFPFVDGLDDGKSQITSLRLKQNYTRRGNSSLFTVDSQFNIGLDIFDATKSEAGIDGLFWSWGGNIQWIQTVNRQRDSLLKFSIATQLTPDKLLPLEQLAIGGHGSIRGYRQNLVVGDNGVFGVIEGQFPVIKSNQWGNVYLVPFVDFGTIWNNYAVDRDTPFDTIASLGLEFNYRLGDFLDTKVFYAIPLVENDSFESSSIEEKWGFSVSFIPFTF